MAFTTKLDFSNNRQVKQRIETIQNLSGATSFGVTFSALPTGPDTYTSGITQSIYIINSSFSGNSGTTNYSWYDSRMSLGEPGLSAITPSNSATTQNTGSWYTADTFSTIDGNTIATTYTGVSFNINITGMTDLGGGNYSGTLVTNTLNILSAGTLDFTGRTIWNDTSGITRTERLIVTNNPQVGYVLTCADTEGMVSWSPSSGGSSGSTASVWTAGTGTGSVVLSGSSSIASGNFSVGGAAYGIASGVASSIEGGVADDLSPAINIASGISSHAEGMGNVASGWGSHAEGNGNEASGDDGSHAEGLGTIASGDVSHAEGRETIASANWSHAEGYASLASGSGSHAEGGDFLTQSGGTASGAASHAEGILTTAIGIASHAEGTGTTASGNYSHTEGYDTTASSNASHAEGASTIASNDASHAEGIQTTASGAYSHSEGSGTIAYTIYSHAEGFNTRSSGDTSHAEGRYTTSNGTGSHSEGNSTIASGEGSHAEGNNTQAIANYTHAEGFSTIATGNIAHAEGESTIATGNTSHAEGYSTKAWGAYSHSEGESTTAIYQSSHAEGYNTRSNGYASHSEGHTTYSQGNNSHAEGFGTQAIGNQSHSEGAATIANGPRSHAEGDSCVTTLLANGGHAEGSATTASNYSSHSEGHNTTAAGYASHAGGINSRVSGDYSFIHSVESNLTGNRSAMIAGSGMTGTANDTLYTPNIVSVYGISAATFVSLNNPTANYTELASSSTASTTTIIGNFNMARPYNLSGDSQTGFLGSFNVAYWDRDTAFNLTHPTSNLCGIDGSAYVNTSATTTLNRINCVRASLYSILSGVTITDANYFITNAPNTTAMYGMQAVYGFHMEPHAGVPGFTAGTTNLWGVYIDDNDANNYFGRNVWIGTTSGSEYLDVNGNGRFRNIGTAASSGALHYTANGTLTTNTSDARLKTNIKTLTGALAKVNGLRGVTYNWNENPSGDTRIGFIAQEINAVVPELAFVNPNSPEQYMGVHYDNVTALLVEAVKELSSGVTTSNNTHLETQTILAEDNNIELNYSGTSQTAIGGGITVLHARGENLGAELITDADGNWVTNNDFKSKFLSIPLFTPTSTNDNTGNEGNITRDSDYLYVKTNSKWKRVKFEEF